MRTTLDKVRMADKKIFREIEGIFGWIEKRNKLESKGHDDVVLDSKLQLQEFFKFLGVDEISDVNRYIHSARGC